MSPIEAALAKSLRSLDAKGPPQLGAAIHHAVFGGGGRVRPRLCLAVGRASGADDADLLTATACAIEMLHCASLVHDDLPCFDDAATRRGRPSVHAAFGEPLAVLAGDALIVHAFETVALAGTRSPARLPGLIGLLGRAAGAAEGLVAGQGWESEPRVPVERYHRAKTGALFVAATAGGALAAGADPTPWTRVGDLVGEAYQVADDLCDAHASAELAGKPTGQDAAHDRPSAVRTRGTQGALRRLRTLVSGATKAVPDGPRAEGLRQLITGLAERLVPPGLEQSAA